MRAASRSSGRQGGGRYGANPATKLEVNAIPTRRRPPVSLSTGRGRGRERFRQDLRHPVVGVLHDRVP